MISTDLNRAVVGLLHQLLFWQERLKANEPHKLGQRKRLVSGLRCTFSLAMFVSLDAQWYACHHHQVERPC